ncbi:MAG: MFS transporter [Rhodobiaceae bacterium]|nr:MFS transporter [Rhodobiaceae bacterium]
MTSPLLHKEFRKLFAAQILSLLGIGVMTVSLSLSSFQFGGVSAGGRILGGILALKMIAYVLIAPLAEPVLSRLPRRPVLAAIDLVRLGMVGLMGFATASWQVAALAFLFFAVSSGFTPLFQSVLPDLLPDEESYSKALALSRIAYTLESILSPTIAAAALWYLKAGDLFFLASVCFVGSVAALLVTQFPEVLAPQKSPFLQRLSRGIRIYVKTPRLRGVFLINLALALAMAWVLVNTVVYAGARLGNPDHYYTLLMACYGVGAASAALLVPKLVARAGERRVMASGAFLFAALGLTILLAPPVPGLIVLWFGFGAASSLVLTPGGLVIARSAERANRPAVFAAQFSLSHAGWLVAYPLAGWLGSVLSPEPALVVLSMACAFVTIVALRIWPASEERTLEHSHAHLPPDHPHLRDHPAAGKIHSHDYYIDDLHPRWPGLAA